MKIENTTTLPTKFWQSLIHWVLREHKVNSRKVHLVKLCNSSKGSSFSVTEHTRRASWGTDIYRIILRLGPEEGKDLFALPRLYHMVLLLSKALCESRMSSQRLPQGDLAFYRQPCGMKFAEQGSLLIQRWRDKAKPMEKATLVERRLQRAEQLMKQWQTKLKLANTKYKAWSHKVSYYKKRLEENSK